MARVVQGTIRPGLAPQGAGPRIDAPEQEAILTDGAGREYRCAVYRIDALPHAHDVFYAFCAAQGGLMMPRFVPVFVGVAADLRDCLAGHDRRDVGHARLAEAKALGARHLLVYRPRDLIDPTVTEAERWLIERHRPALNPRPAPRRTYPPGSWA